ncbi:MAG: hypothetical protein ACI9SP_002016 [Arenicella sp.]|jgi:hypothetical protein
MSKILQDVMNHFSSGNFAIGILILGFLMLINIKPLNFFIFLMERKKNDIKHLLMLAESDIFDDDSKKGIREYLEMYSFRECYGIQAGKTMRNTLVKYHADFNGKLSWFDLKKSYKHLTLTGRRLSVKFTRWQHFGYWASTTYIVLLYCYSASLLYVGLTTMVGNIQIFSVFGVAVLVLIFAMAFSTSVTPYWSAKRVKSILEEN